MPAGLRGGVKRGAKDWFVQKHKADVDWAKLVSLEQNSPIENDINVLMVSCGEISFGGYRGRRDRERERASERHDWELTETFSSVTVAPGATVAPLFCMAIWQEVTTCFIMIPQKTIMELPRIYLSHVCFRQLCVCLLVCVCVLGFFSYRQQRRLADCAWEVGGRNSRGLNQVS